MIATVQPLYNEVICFSIYIKVVKSGRTQYLGHASFYTHLHGQIDCTTHMLVRLKTSHNSGKLAAKSFGTNMINSYLKTNVRTERMEL